MRFLPYLLIFFMALPIFAWVAIDVWVIKGNSTVFSGMDKGVLLSLGAFMLAAFGLLARWMDKMIVKTRR